METQTRATKATDPGLESSRATGPDKSASGPSGPSRRFQGCSSLKAFVTISKLGEGTFGEVYKARVSSTGQLVAMKKILMHQEKEGFPVTALREIRLLKILRHPNILKLQEMIIERVKGDGRKKAVVYMVTPYMDHDLAGLLENPAVSFQVPQIKCYMMQLLRGVAYLHARKILHRDMKAANLLINNRGNLQIADFGLARTYDDPAPIRGRGNGDASRGYTTMVVTRWYRPPELLLQLRQYTPAVDIWGVGCVFGEFFTRKPILPGTTDVHQLQLIFELVGSPTEKSMPGWDLLPGCEGFVINQARKSTIHEAFPGQDPAFISLLAGLLDLDWRKRLNAMDALEHAYFSAEPLPSRPENIPEFPESHELDRKAFQEQKARNASDKALNTQAHDYQRPRNMTRDDHVRSISQNSEERKRHHLQDARQYDNPTDSKDASVKRSKAEPSFPQTAPSAINQNVPRGLPSRPPVEIPRAMPENRIRDFPLGPPRYGNRSHHPPFERPPHNRVDSYIPSYRRSLPDRYEPGDRSRAR